MHAPTRCTFHVVHARRTTPQSYTFKALVRSEAGKFDFQELNMNKTLAENGVSDETAAFEDLLVNSEDYIPVLHVYWNDDLTVA